MNRSARRELAFKLIYSLEVQKDFDNETVELFIDNNCDEEDVKKYLSETAKGILKNTSFVTIMSLPPLDRSNVNELLQIPTSQLSFITNSQKGHGLIYTGDTILPFNNEYPRDTKLYQIMQTSE